MAKYFRVDVDLVPGAIVPLDEHRFLDVLRLGEGDAITLCGSNGVLFSACIRSTSPLLAALRTRLGNARAAGRAKTESAEMKNGTERSRRAVLAW